MASGEVARAKTLTPGRIRFPQISSRAYEHPADRGALVALRALPGFDQVLRALSGVVGDRSIRLLHVADSIRVSHRQYPALQQLLDEATATLDIATVPELFVVRDPMPRASTLGLNTPFIEISTGALDLLDAEGLRFVLGHELGHVLSGHAVYHTMLRTLVSISNSISWVPVGGLALRVLLVALDEWFRKSELSGDRAGLLVGQDAGAALRVHAILAGATDPDEMDVSGFLDQAVEYDRGGDIRDSFLKLMHLGGRSHPLAAVRAAELQKWAAGPEYRAILSGDYPRRGDDADAAMSDEARAAARSYKDSFTSSGDPLFRFVREAGGLFGGVSGVAGTVAGGLGDWLRTQARGAGGRPGSNGRHDDDDVS
jgi:Zn-dependent protease with chaperone function